MSGKILQPPRCVPDGPLTRLAATPGVWSVVLTWLGRADLSRLLRASRVLAYDAYLRGQMLNGATGSRWLQATRISMASTHWRRWAAASPPIPLSALVARCNQTITTLSWDRAGAWPALPSGLTSLAIDWCFTQPIVPGALPSSLTALRFQGYFDQPLVPGLLPASLTSLQFKGRFNQPLGLGVLPEGLAALTLGWNFDQPMVLPASLIRS